MQEIVLFGGKAANGAYLGDTWTYRGGVWNETGASGPTGRQDPSMAYYPPGGDLVLFGGFESGSVCASDTWLFSSGSWSLSSATGPTGRYDAGMTYFSALSKIVLFGGENCGGTQDGDTWLLSGSPGAWSAGPAGGPSARDGAVLADDQANSEALLFGGFSNGYGWHNDTWVLSTTPTWANITRGLVPEPGARADEGMAWDASSSTVIMAGGFGTASPGSFNDTWSFVSGAWTELTGTGDPFSGRSLSPLAYDATDKSLVLFGGNAIGNSFQDDTWALSGTSLSTLQWAPTHLAPLSVNAPPGRIYDSLAYDSTDNAVFLFGGQGTHIFNDLWEFQNGLWTNRTPGTVTATNNPPFRESAGMVWDNGTDTLYLFGGAQYGGSAFLSDLWAYSVGSSSWSQVVAGGPPTARSGFGMVWDPAQGVVLIGGGYGSSGFTSSMATYSPSKGWHSLSTPLPQGAVSGLVMAWDPNAGAALDYGGDDGSVNYPSTWTIQVVPPTSAFTSELSSADLTGGVSYPWYGYSAASSTALVFEGYNLNGPSLPLSSTLTFSTTTDSWTNIAASAGTPPDSTGESNLVADTGGSFFFGAGGSPEITVPSSGGPNPYYAAVPDWIFGPDLASTLAFPGSVTSGGTLSGSVVASGGSGNYRYVWYGLPAPCSSSSSALSCVPSSVGVNTTYTVQVDAVDSLGDVSSHTVSLVEHPAITATVGLSPGAIDSGQSVTYTASPSGGSGTYTFTWQNLPVGCPSPGGVSTFTCTPSSVVTNTTYSTTDVQITDSAGGSTLSPAPPLTVDAPPSASAITGTPAAGADGGQTVQFSVVPSGGTAGYSYLWAGLPSGCASANVRILSCTTSLIASNATTTVTVTVTDALGDTATGTPLGYTVHRDPYALGVYLSSISYTGQSSASIDAGQTVTIYADPHGGLAPYTFSWTGLPPGCTAPTSSYFTCTPTGGSNTTYTIGTQVTDANGVLGGASYAYLTVAPALAVSGISIVGSNPDDSGVAVSFQVTATAGSGSYAYAWSGLPAGCVSSDVRILPCIPSVGANTTYNSIQVQVTDTGGDSLSSVAGGFTVHPAVTLGPVSGTPTSIDSTQTVIFSATPSGGSGVYTFSWSSLPTPCSTVNVDRLSCTANVAVNSTYLVTLTARDSLGETAGSTLTYTVDAAVGIASISFVPASVDAGQTVQILAAPTGGSGAYAFTWTGLPAGTCTGTSTAAPSCVTSGAGSNVTYSAIHVTVQDTHGLATGMTAAPFQVNGDPQVSSITVSPSPMDSGELLTMSAVPTSGSGSYAFSWQNLPSGCTSANLRILSCTPSVASNSSFTNVDVKVTDSLGGTVTSAAATVTVYVYPTVSAITITPLGGVDSGDHVVTFSAKTTGGSGSYAFSWSGLPFGCSSANTPFLTCLPSVAVNNTFNAISVMATDTVGGHPVSPAASYQVYEDPQISSLSPSPGSSIDSGQTLTLQALPSFGDGTYAFSWTGLPSFCSPQNARILTCTVSVISNTTFPGIHLCLNDTAFGMACAFSTSVVALVAPTVSAITPSPSGSDDAGVPASFSVSAGGGEAGYTFTWSGLPSGCSTQNTPHLTCTPSGAANQSYAVQVSMRDSTGVSVSSSVLSYEVHPSLQVTAVSVTPGVIDSGSAVSISAVATLGSGSYTWSWSSLPAGCSPSNSPIITCAPSVSANQTFSGISVTVTDGIGPGATPSAGSLQVDALPRVSTISLSPASGTIESGFVLTLNVTATRGSGGYAFSWTGLPAGCATQDTPYLQCTPSVPSNTSYASIQVQVVDSAGSVVSSAAAVERVLARVTLSSISTSPAGAVVDSGQSVTFSAKATDGDGAYSFLWTGLPSGCAPNTLPVLTCAPTSGTNSTVSLQLSVTDGQNMVAQSTLSFRVLEDPQLSAVTYSADPVESGQTLTLSVHASYGNGAYVFAWSNLPSGCSPSNAPSITCTPTVATNSTYGSISVGITDSLGATASQNGGSLQVLEGIGASAISSSPSAGVDSGQTVVFSVAASGGDGVYSFSWTNLPSGCSSSSTPDLVCVPSVGTNTTFPGIDVTVTDGLSASVAAPATSYLVWSAPHVTLASFSANPIESGQSVTMRVVATGGDGVYAFSWLGLPTGCSTVSSPVLTCSPTTSTNMTFSSIQVQVTDGTSAVVISGPPSPPLTVDGALQVGPIVASPALVETGQTLSLSVSATVGSGSYAFAWSNLPSGCSTSNAPVLTCTPSVATNTTFAAITVLVTDTLGGYGSPSPASVAVLAHVATSAVASSRWEMEVGESATFTVTPSLGDGSYSFVWTLLPSCASIDAGSVSCTATSTGLTAVSVVVSDGLGSTVTSLSFDMQVLPPVAAGTLISNASSVDLGYSVQFTASPSQGLGPYSLSWTGLPAGCASANVTALVCRPTVAGSFWVRAVAADVLGGSNSTTVVSLLVSSGPSITSLVGTPWSVDVGQASTLTATVVGGAGTLTFLWSGLPSGCTASNLASLPCTPTAAGTTTVVLQVTDAQGGFASASLPFTVYTDLSVSVSAPSGTSTETGVALPLGASVSSGSPGYHTFVWAINGSGPVSPPDNTSTFDLLVTHGGTYVVTLTVYDSNAYPGTGSSPPLTVALRLSVSIRGGFAPVLDAGQSTSLQATPSGGLGTLSWQWFDGGVAVGASCQTSTCAFAATSTGVHALTVVATDAAGFTATSPSVNISVNNPPSVALPLTYTTAVGQSVTLSANVTPGTPGYRYVWYVNGSALPVQSGPLGTYAFTASRGGTYEIWVVVNDSVGVAVKSANSTVVVEPATATVGVVLTIAGASGNSIALDGTTYSANGSVVLGLRGTYTLTETPGANYAFVDWQSSGGVVVQSATSGATTVTVNGAGTLTAVFSFNGGTTAPSHNPGGGGNFLGSGLFLGLLLLVVVIAALAAALLLRSRRRRSATAAGPAGEEGPSLSAGRGPHAGPSPALEASRVDGPSDNAGRPSAVTATPSPPSVPRSEAAATGTSSLPTLSPAASTASRPPVPDWQEEETPAEDWQEEEAGAPAPGVAEGRGAETGAAASAVPAEGSGAIEGAGSRPKLVLGAKGASRAASAGEGAGARIVPKEPPWPMVPLTVVEVTDKARFWRMAAASGLDRSRMLILSLEAPGIVTGTYGMHGATIYRLSRSEGESNVSPGDADRLGYLIESHFEEGSGRAVIIDGIASVIDASNIRTARRLIELTHEMAEKTSGAALVWVNPETMGQVERRQLSEKAVVRRLR